MTVKEYPSLIYSEFAVNENWRQHLRVSSFWFGIEVRIASWTVVPNGVSEAVAPHYLFAPVGDVGAQVGQPLHGGASRSVVKSFTNGFLKKSIGCVHDHYSQA